VTAGTPFSVTVRAVDNSYYLASTAANTITITGSHSATQSYPASTELVNGEKVFSVTERQNATGHYFIATTTGLSGSDTAHTTNLITQAGALSKLLVIMPGVTYAPGTTNGKSGTPTAQTVNDSLTASIRVYTTDDNWNKKAVATALTCTLSTTSGSSYILDKNTEGLTDGNFEFGVGADSVLFARGEFKFGTTGSHTVSATSAIADYTTSSVTVNAGAASKILVQLPGQSFANETSITGTASGQTAGGSFDIALYVVDANNNKVSETGSRTIDFFSNANNSPNGTQPTIKSVFSPYANQSVSFTNGVSANVAVILYKAESGVVLKARDDSGSPDSTSSSQITVTFGALDNFAVSITSSQQRNVNFTGTNTVTAQDAYNNTVTNFDASGNYVTMSVQSEAADMLLIASRGNAVLNLNGDFSSGVANLTALGIKYKLTGTAGTKTIVATSADVKTGQATDIVINATAPTVSTPNPSNDTQISSGASSQTLSASLSETNSGGLYTLYWLKTDDPDDTNPTATANKSATAGGGALSASLNSTDLSGLAGSDYVLWWFGGTDGAENALTATPITSSRARLILDPTVSFTGEQICSGLTPGAVMARMLHIAAQGEMAGMNVAVTRIQLTKSGTATSADIDTLKLYHDADSSQTVTAGDAVLQTVVVFGNDTKLNSPNFTSFSQAVSGTHKVHFLVTISIHSPANANNTIGYRINAPTDVGLSTTVADVGGTFPVPSVVVDQSLPVVLTSFTAAIEGNVVVLK